MVYNLTSPYYFYVYETILAEICGLEGEERKTFDDLCVSLYQEATNKVSTRG